MITRFDNRSICKQLKTIRLQQARGTHPDNTHIRILEQVFQQAVNQAVCTACSNLSTNLNEVGEDQVTGCSNNLDTDLLQQDCDKSNLQQNQFNFKRNFLGRT